MNMKDYQSPHRHLYRAPPKPRRRRSDRPGLAAALLGVICVAGVFGLLGLLYSLE
jgi:hypothetical protein